MNRYTAGLEGSMSRRGNCHDNAVAENFLQLLKRERIKRLIYAARGEARSDTLDDLKCFITAGIGLFQASRHHRLNMKTYFFNG